MDYFLADASLRPRGCQVIDSKQRETGTLRREHKVAMIKQKKKGVSHSQIVFAVTNCQTWEDFFPLFSAAYGEVVFGREP